MLPLGVGAGWPAGLPTVPPGQSRMAAGTGLGMAALSPRWGEPQPCHSLASKVDTFCVGARLSCTALPKHPGTECGTFTLSSLPIPGEMLFSLFPSSAAATSSFLGDS